MDKKETVLIRVSYLIDITDEHLIEENGIIDEITKKIDKDKVIDIDGNNVKLEWIGTSTIPLNTQVFNCGRCSNCGQWVTDREKPEVIVGLCNGAEVDGKLLCDECLQPDHRRAF